MTDIVELSGNIFSTTAEAIVITVNTEGVMGAGIALDAKLRWPQVFDRYAKACGTGEMAIGRNLIMSAEEAGARLTVICLATKKTWKLPSRLAYVQAGVDDLADRIAQKGLRSVAIPHLGCSHGGLSWTDVRPVVVRAIEPLEHLERAELWAFEEARTDPDFERLIALLARTDDEIAQKLAVRTTQVRSLRAALRLERVRGLTSLPKAPGVGEGTMRAVYRYLFAEDEPEQQELFG